MVLRNFIRMVLEVRGYDPRAKKSYRKPERQLAVGDIWYFSGDALDAACSQANATMQGPPERWKPSPTPRPYVLVSATGGDTWAPISSDPKGNLPIPAHAASGWSKYIETSSVVPVRFKMPRSQSDALNITRGAPERLDPRWAAGL